jgi:[protein-PII] uridylyltransferase
MPGVIVDSFHFTDIFHTSGAEPERERIGSWPIFMTLWRRGLSVEQLLEARRHMNHPTNLKVEVPTRLQFDNESSTHSTLLQVVAQDVPGLLRQIALTLRARTNATSRWR